MAGRHEGDDFWASLDHWTLRTYAHDFFAGEHHRSIIGVICGVMFVIDGVVRMYTDPGVQSLGVILVGSSVAVFCFLVPVLTDLGFAYAGRLVTNIRRTGD